MSSDLDHISLRMRSLLLEEFTAVQLRHMAASLEARAPERLVRRKWREMLDDASFEELAEMLVTGRTPTVGWWNRHRKVAA